MPRKAAPAKSKGKKTPVAPPAPKTVAKVAKAPKPAKGTKDRLQRIFANAAIQKINKDSGAELILKASESKAIEDQRIPSGIAQVDLALGGGWPVGRVINLWGHKSSGKTTLLLKMIAQAQNLCSNCWNFKDINTGKCGCPKFRDTVCAYVDVEGTLDKTWMLRQGVNLDRLLLSQPALAEQALTVADGLLQTGDVDILILDSIAFLRPKKEAEKTMEEGMVGEQARIVGRGTRAWVSNLNFGQLKFARRPTIFTTNQVRMKVGVMFGNPETQPGGMAPGFAASVEVKTRAGKMELDNEVPIEQEFFFDVEKNKTGVPRKAGSYKLIAIDGELRRMGDVADEDFLMDSAEQFGLITKEGNDWVCLEERFSAKGHINKKVLTDMPFSRALRRAVSEVARLKGLAGVRGLVAVTTPDDEEVDDEVTTDDVVEVSGEDVVEVEAAKAG